jgi:hypothetical protein
MTYTLTAAQITDFREDIADTNSAFSDAQLQRLYNRADGDYQKAVVLALRQLWMNAAKFNDYTAGESVERKNQIFDNLERTLAKWEGIAGMAGGQLEAGTVDHGLDQDASTSLDSRLSEWTS